MDVAGIDVRMAIERTEITVGEPIYIDLHLTNRSTMTATPVFSASLQMPEGNDLSVYVTAPGEVEARLEGAVEQGVYSAMAIDVPPGRTIDHRLTVIYDRTQKTGYVFDQPGEYNLRIDLGFSVSFSPEHRTLSMAGKILVRPGDADAAEAWKMVADPESAKALQLGRVTTDELKSKFSAVGEKYPRTVHGKLCLRAVALEAAYGVKRDPKGALEPLRKYESTYRGEPDTDLIAYTIAGAYHVQGNTDLARHWLYYMMDEYPNSTLLRKQDPLYRFYYQDPAEAVIKFPWFLTETPWVVPGAKLPTNLMPIQD